MTSARIFTLEEANSLIPTLGRIVERQLELQGRIEERLRALTKLTGNIPRELSVEDADPSDVRTIKLDLIDRITTYQKGWEEVGALGAVLKDPRTGLIDFYGRLDGRTVWLCWKYGESQIEFFHELDTGAIGRKPLSADARQRLLN